MKAMMGSGIDPEMLRLLDEIRTLRARVAELEDALETAETVRDEVAGIDAPTLVDASAGSTG